MKLGFLSLLSGAILCASTAIASEVAPSLTPEQQRLSQLSEQLSIPLTDLESAFSQATYRQDVIDAITRPWEAKPWHQYRGLFLKPERLTAGLAFWEEHQAILEQAEQEFQVPAQIIVAIIGVETYYGRFTGTYPVIDALYTLGFHYPARSEFFSKEFAHYVKLSQQQGWDLASTKGSYAGAMGLGQFIPSSYLYYGVDFDGDQKVDMLNNPVDAIGSVANYFHQHRWQYGEDVVYKATATEDQAAPWLRSELKLSDQWQQLAASGISSQQNIAPERAVKLLQLEEEQGYSHWLALDNFYVITRYNRSPLYAMAVYQFSEQLRQAREQQ